MKPKEWEQFKELLRKNNPDKEIDFDNEFDKSLSHIESIEIAKGKKLKVEPPLSPLEKSLAIYYKPILQEARKAATRHRERAKEFVPKMYKTLKEVYDNLKIKFDPLKAREMIVKDLRGDWDKDTIVGLLPPEAKDSVKREAGLASGRVRKNRTARSKMVEVPLAEQIKAKIIALKDKRLALLEDISDLKNIRIESVIEKQVIQEAEPVMTITAQEAAKVIKEEYRRAKG